MALGKIPVPLAHPMMDQYGLVTKPWADYFRAIASGTDSDLGLYMLKSEYDADGDGAADNSEALQGQSGSYYLSLGNSTGILRADQIGWNGVNVFAAYTAVAGDLVVANVSGGGFTVTLPDAAACRWQSVAVKKDASAVNTLTIACSLSQTIDGSATVTTTTANAAYLFVSDGINWMQLY